MTRRPWILAACALTAILVLPAAASHTTVPTSDGRYFVTAGNLNEPVSTYTKTGLDLIIRYNESGQRGAEVPGQHLNVTATLVAPNGEELTMPLTTQFGSVGRYSFEEPYYLTQPGEYFLEVGGNLEGNPVDVRVLVGSGPIPAFEDLTFPDDVPNALKLQQENAALKERVNQLEIKVQAMENQESRNSVPNVGAIALVGILVGLALVVRRRA